MKVIKPSKGKVMDVELEKDILLENERLASLNRKILEQRGILGINVMGSIGSGKTTIVEQIVKKVGKKTKVGVIAGDLTTTIDADRIKRHGAEVVQVNTGKECHLDAELVRRALKKLDLNKIKLLIIENVGNLICPAEFPLGTHRNLVVVSITEGPFMVVKHPAIFREADVVAINKVDMSRAMGISPEKLVRDVKRINPSAKVVKTVARKGKGIEAVISGLGIGFA